MALDPSSALTQDDNLRPLLHTKDIHRYFLNRLTMLTPMHIKLIPYLMAIMINMTLSLFIHPTWGILTNSEATAMTAPPRYISLTSSPRVLRHPFLQRHIVKPQRHPHRLQ